MGILRELFVANQFIQAGDDEEKLEAVREQERKYREYQQRQDEWVDQLFVKIGKLFK